MQLPLSPPEPVLTNLSYPQLHESGLASKRAGEGAENANVGPQEGTEPRGVVPRMNEHGHLGKTATPFHREKRKLGANGTVGVEPSLLAIESQVIALHPAQGIAQSETQAGVTGENPLAEAGWRRPHTGHEDITFVEQAGESPDQGGVVLTVGVERDCIAKPAARGLGEAAVKGAVVAAIFRVAHDDGARCRGEIGGLVARAIIDDDGLALGGNRGDDPGDRGRLIERRDDDG